MVPNPPVIERIAQHILQSLTDVKRSGGFANDFEVVARRRRSGNTPEADKITVIIDQFLRGATDDASVGQSEWDQQFGLQIYVPASEDLNTPVDAVINSVVSDAELALVGNEQAFNRGGLALSTKIFSVDPFIEAAFQGVFVHFIVRYATVYNAPQQSAYQ